MTRIIFTRKEIPVGKKVAIYAPTARIGEEVKFCHVEDTWGLKPFGTGKCVGETEVVMTPSAGGVMKNAFRSLREFLREK